MARLQATSRSRWGNSGRKGNWVLGLCDPRRWLQKPAQSLSGLCPPPTCRLDPSCTACAPAGCASPSSCNFLSQEDSWGRGSGLVLLSDLQPIWE